MGGLAMEQGRKCPLSTNDLEIHFSLYKLFSLLLCLKVSTKHSLTRSMSSLGAGGGDVQWSIGYFLCPLKTEESRCQKMQQPNENWSLELCRSHESASFIN